MKLPIRQQKRGQMFAQLQANGFNVKEGEDKDLVIEDSRGNKTRLVFDEKYTPQKIVKPSGLEYAFTFDSNDHLVKFSFPGNESIGFNYQDDLLKAILLNEGRIELNYDDKGRITEVISQDDKSYKIGYNVSAQVETITNRANETRRFDSAIKGSHLVHSMKDSLGRVTQVETDPMGEEGDTIRFPDGTEQTSVYDDDLDALVTTLRSGAKVHTYYDGASPSRVEWEDGNFQNLELNGEQVKAIENPAGSLRFEYDDKGQVLSEEFQGNKTRYTYDKDGNLLEMAYPSGLVVKYSYDEDGRLQSLKVGDDTCTYKYGPNDTVAKVYYPNGLTQKRSEKVLGGLQAAQVVNPSGTVLSQQTYQYDNLYRLTRYNNFDASSQSPSKDWQLRYDDEWRLLSSLEANSQRLEKFEYDHKGNLSSVNGSPVTVGRMDEVLSMGGSTVQYDANGNVRSFVNAQGRTVALTFNDNNELKLARIGEDTWEYWYDGLGRRVGKSNGREAYKFCWGSEKLLTEELRTPEGTTLREYLYGHNAAVPVAFRENGQLFWLHSDVRGAVTQVFDTFGQVVWSAEYSAFGEATIHRGRIRQPWRLTGQYHDAEIGLHYSTARYYSPHLKSFLSLDRYWLEYEASNYGYAGNDPYNKIDVDGNLPIFLVVAIPIVKAIAVRVAIYAAKIAVEGAVMGAVGYVAENLMSGKDIKLSCVLDAAWQGAKDALSDPLNWIPGRIPGKKGPKPPKPNAVPTKPPKPPKPKKADKPKEAPPKPKDKKEAPKTSAKTAQQKKAIDDVESGKTELNTNARKGNYGEMKTDVDLESKGYEPLHKKVTDIDGPTEQGIDHVFKKGDPPKYYVVESKYNTSNLKNLKDGTRQMSDDWISGRLNDSVGKDVADEIRASGFERVVARTSPDGTITYKKVGADGYETGSFEP